MSPGASLLVENLDIFSATKHLVTGVSLTVHTGQVLGLVGESGSGKSLTCQSIVNLLPEGLQWRGSIEIETREGAASRERRRLAAIILQNPMSCFNPVYTVKTHFRETLKASGKSWNAAGRSEAVTTLYEVGFEDPWRILHCYPFQMSGGMLQRVMIALALIQEVEFLVADEPTTDLDMVAQEKILTLLENLKEKKGIGILLVTHDLGVIARLADEVAVMHQGRIVEQGGMEKVFFAPEHRYSRELIQAHVQLCSAHQTDTSVQVQA